MQTEFTQFFQEIFPFWNQISTAQQEQLSQQTTRKRFGKGETIHGAGGVCTGGIIVKTGCVRTYIMSDEGKEITLYRLYPGHMCMLSASCVLEAITFEVFVDAVEDSECYIFNGHAFAEISKENLHAENFALQMAVNRFSDVMWVMQQILFMSFDKRLAIFLDDEMRQTGESTIHLTQEQIARYMGSAREVVSRMLKYFAAEGIAGPVRGGVRILDKGRLRALAIQ